MGILALRPWGLGCWRDYVAPMYTSLNGKLGQMMVSVDSTHAYSHIFVSWRSIEVTYCRVGMTRADPLKQGTITKSWTRLPNSLEEMLRTISNRHARYLRKLICFGNYKFVGMYHKTTVYQLNWFHFSISIFLNRTYSYSLVNIVLS